MKEYISRNFTSNNFTIFYIIGFVKQNEIRYLEDPFS